ncbi:MAG: DNA translocase FtsK 4TM domain-containing protein, partial [Granulosicoccus sp.]
MAQAIKKKTATARKKKTTAARRPSANRRATTAGARKTAASARSGQSVGPADTLTLSASWLHMRRLFREVGGILCIFASLIALLALTSFNIDDPGWSQTGAGNNISNTVGRAGAWFADVSFYLFGYMAYLMPLMLAMSGWLLFREQAKARRGYQPLFFVRIVGVLLMLLSASALADLHFGVNPGDLPMGTFGGGILGTAIAWRLVNLLQHA